MNIKQPDTLFQTMEKWLIAYQAKHNCNEDTALDKFDEMSDTIRASGKGSTATEFHNEVKASLEEMTLKKSAPESTKLPQHVGGPLLETGVDPLGFVNGSLDVMGVVLKGRRYNEAALEKADAAIAELNTQTLEGSGKAAHKLITHEESIKNEIAYLTKTIGQYKSLGDPVKDHPDYETYLLQVGRLEMLEELQKRQQVRTGRILSLPKKR